MLASVMALIVGFLGGGAGAQTPISGFAEFAGKWSGASDRGTKIALEVDPSGKFKLDTPLGKDSGTAKIDGGVLVIPFSDNQGSYKLSKSGDALIGPAHWRGNNATVRLTRDK
jgi:hypothetical protein